MSPRAWMRFIFALRSRNGAKNATNIGVEERSTPARPEGMESSPGEIRMNGAAIASAPSRIACRGRRRMSTIMARPPPFDEGYRQEPDGTGPRLEERDLDRREVHE